MQEVLAQLPWYHQLALLDKLPNPETRRWYALKAIEHNWSRNILVIQIETRQLEPIGYIPPAEAEENYYRQLAEKTKTPVSL